MRNEVVISHTEDDETHHHHFPINSSIMPVLEPVMEGLDGRKWLSPKEFAIVTGLSIATIFRRLGDGRITKVQPGGKGTRVLISIEALDVQRQAHDSAVPLTQVARSESIPVHVKSHEQLAGRRPLWMSQ